jgi:hypothetical protein
MPERLPTPESLLPLPAAFVHILLALADVLRGDEIGQSYNHFGFAAGG